MADYSLHHSPRPSRHAIRNGWALTALAAVMIAALAWVWTEQQSAQMLPQTTEAPAAAPGDVHP